MSNLFLIAFFTVYVWFCLNFALLLVNLLLSAAVLR